MTDDLHERITASIVEGQPDLAVALTRQALEAGKEPMEIIDRGLVPGMEIAGEKFERNEYFIPHLMIAADGMQKAMALLEPELRAREQARPGAGTVVIGTVLGDIHEIGKSLVATMLSANGFTVHDLGVDVRVEAFVEKVKETDADLLGMSALLTTTMVVQRQVIEALDEAGVRGQVQVMIGGAPVSQRWADEIGADGHAKDAVSAVRLAQELIGKV